MVLTGKATLDSLIWGERWRQMLKPLITTPVQIGAAGRLSSDFDEREQATNKLVDIDRLFKGRHFGREVIVLCVRWYVHYKFSLRDFVEIMAERGLSLAHTTIMRWVTRFTPEFVKRWDRFARSAGRSWRVDDTYVKVRGKWVYLSRAIDRAGKTVDFRLSARRDVTAAKAFLAKAVRSRGLAPKTIRLDGYAACHRAVHEMKAEQFLPAGTTLRSSKYLNNLIEQDHRNVKFRVNAMLGFKRYRNAAITISGVEPMHRIRKGQFNLARLRLKDTTAPVVWKAVLEGYERNLTTSVANVISEYATWSRHLQSSGQIVVHGVNLS